MNGWQGGGREGGARLSFDESWVIIFSFHVYK